MFSLICIWINGWVNNREAGNLRPHHGHYDVIVMLISSRSCLWPVHWSQVLSRKWRCSWSSADRRCSNCISVINKFFAYWGVTNIRGLIVSHNTEDVLYWKTGFCIISIAVDIFIRTIIKVFLYISRPRLVPLPEVTTWPHQLYQQFHWHYTDWLKFMPLWLKGGVIFM